MKTIYTYYIIFTSDDRLLNTIMVDGYYSFDKNSISYYLYAWTDNKKIFNAFCKQRDMSLFSYIIIKTKRPISVVGEAVMDTYTELNEFVTGTTITHKGVKKIVTIPIYITEYESEVLMYNFGMMLFESNFEELVDLKQRVKNRKIFDLLEFDTFCDVYNEIEAGDYDSFRYIFPNISSSITIDILSLYAKVFAFTYNGKELS